MTENVMMRDWSGGINNLAPPNRLPEGFVRDLLNLDPVGGNVEMRTGYELVLPGTGCRALMSLGSKILYVDGTDLIELDVLTNATRILRTVAGAGGVASCVFNNELFISTVNETLRYDGRAVREWGVPDVTVQPYVTITNQKAGRRLYAATFTNAQGEEGGTAAAASVPEGVYSFVLPAPPAGGKVNIYVSALNGQTLYLQGSYTAGGAVTVNRPVDDTRALATMHMRKPLPAAHLASADGVILSASGSTVFVTAPLIPHLTAPLENFFQFPTDVGLLLAGDQGVYVSADKVYRLSGVDTNEPRQDTAADYPAVPGTGTILPDGRAVWMTRYGMSIESTDPREGVLEPTRRAFVPKEASHGASGTVDNNGNEMVVTATKDGAKPNTLAAQDYFEAEVIRP